MQRYRVFALVLVLMMMSTISGLANHLTGPSATYTLTGDFDEGTSINVTTAGDEVKLTDATEAFNFMWVAVSDGGAQAGTIIKIDTNTGQILGRYFSSPQGQPKNPSRTTVDHNGNVWATNRDGNSVVHIGLVENGQCVDRNGNNVIDTSTGPGDLRPWSNADGADTNGGVSTAQDECILHYTRVSSAGTRHVSVDANNDVWVSGTLGSGSRVFNLIDGNTGAIDRTEGPVGYGGYGGLIDANGVIWSALWGHSLLRWDTSNSLSGPAGGNWSVLNAPGSYGLCIDSQGNVWNTGHTYGVIYKFAPNGTLLGTFPMGNVNAQGCVVDGNDDVWIAHSLFNGTVGHLKNDGTFVGNVPVGSGPTGVAVDAAGKIWVTNYNSGTVSRIDPNAGPIGGGGFQVGAVDFTTPYIGGRPYNYSDMTGSTLIGAPDNGTWSVVHDTGVSMADWGMVSWNASTPSDSSLVFTVQSSEDGVNFSPAEVATNGGNLGVPNGRYLKVSVAFTRASTGETPVLYDLTIVADQTPPTCKLIAFSSSQIKVQVQDTGSGLASINVDKAVNTTVTWDPFVVGTTAPVIVTSTKIVAGQPSQTQITVYDVAGNKVTCDPVMYLVVKDAGKPETQTAGGILEAENVVTITNGANGVKNVDVTVNGTRFKVTGLKDNDVHTLDISSAMQPGDDNVVSVSARGPKGSSVSVMVWDGIGE